MYRIIHAINDLKDFNVVFKVYLKISEGELNTRNYKFPCDNFNCYFEDNLFKISMDDICYTSEEAISILKNQANTFKLFIDKNIINCNNYILENNLIDIKPVLADIGYSSKLINIEFIY